MECRFCGLDSEREDVCTWCGRALATPAAPPPPPATTPPPWAPQAPPPGTPPAQVPGPGLPGPGVPPRPGGPLGAPLAAPPVEDLRRAASARRTTIWALGGAGVVAVAVLVVVIIAARPPRFAASQNMKTFEDPSAIVHFPYPSDWTAYGYGKPGSPNVGVSCGKGKFMRFNVEGSMFLSLKAERGRPGLGGDPDTQAHEVLGDYRRGASASWEDTEPQKVFISAGPAVVSEFTRLRRVFITKVRVKGRRYTFKCGDFCLELLAYCPEKDWPKYEPIVDQMVGGLRLNCGQF